MEYRNLASMLVMIMQIFKIFLLDFDEASQHWRHSSCPSRSTELFFFFNMLLLSDVIHILQQMRFFFFFFITVLTPTLFTDKISLAAKENWPGSLWVMQGKGHTNQYTLYVPRLRVLQDIIDSTACLVGALEREIHCATASGVLVGRWTALGLRQPCPFLSSLLLFFFFFFTRCFCLHPTAAV